MAHNLIEFHPSWSQPPSPSLQLGILQLTALRTKTTSGAADKQGIAAKAPNWVKLSTAPWSRPNSELCKVWEHGASWFCEGLGGETMIHLSGSFLPQWLTSVGPF